MMLTNAARYDAKKSGCTADCDPAALLRNAKRMLEEGVWFFGIVEK